MKQPFIRGHQRQVVHHGRCHQKSIHGILMGEIDETALHRNLMVQRGLFEWYGSEDVAYPADRVRGQNYASLFREDQRLPYAER